MRISVLARAAHRFAGLKSGTRIALRRDFARSRVAAQGGWKTSWSNCARFRWQVPDPALRITQILTGVREPIRSFVPSEWAAEPHLRVSDLTRETLRRTLTVFMATGAMNGGKPHAAPFQHQGNGTINMLVLALLSMIAEAKKTVIFAMEEPEIAIPPATPKAGSWTACAAGSLRRYFRHTRPM